MNKTYCLSDLHGHFKVLKGILEKIKFDDSDELYILGDCNDRGSDAFYIYEYIKEKKNIHLIKGNHELMMRDTLKNDTWDCPDGRLWMRNGGKKTIEEMKKYCLSKVNDVKFFDNYYQDFKKKMVEYLESCPSFIELNINNKNYVLIHSGINPEKDLYSQDEEDCAWMREYFYLSKGLDNKTIIFGHTPVCLIHGSHNVWYDDIYKDKIGIDGGLGNYPDGQVNCLCLNDMKVTTLLKADVEDI